MGHTMEQQWGILWNNNGAYHGAYHEQEKGIHGSSNRPYMRAAMRACMGPYMAIYGGSNGACTKAAIGHTCAPYIGHT